MKVDIYATIRRNTYLAIGSGNPIPPSWTARYFKTVVLDPDQPRIGLDAREVIADIESQGWSAIGAEVVVEVKVVG